MKSITVFSLLLILGTGSNACIPESYLESNQRPVAVGRSDDDSDFNLIGAGWCRPGGCDLNDNACGVNGYYKDESNSDECRAACLQEPSCTGYAISTPLHWFPNRCFVHGNILSTETVSGWKVLQKQHFVPTRSTGASNSHCWQRRGEYDIDPATIQEVPPSEPKVQQAPHDQAPKRGNPRSPLSKDCLMKAGVCFVQCRAPPTTCEELDSMLKEGGCASTCPPCVGETMTLIMGCSRIE